MCWLRQHLSCLCVSISLVYRFCVRIDITATLQSLLNFDQQFVTDIVYFKCDEIIYNTCMCVMIEWEWTEHGGFDWSHWRFGVEEWTTSCGILCQWKCTIWFFLFIYYFYVETRNYAVCSGSAEAVHERRSYPFYLTVTNPFNYYFFSYVLLVKFFSVA